MRTLSAFQPAQPIEVLFTDIDDTMTDEGRLTSQAYSALWQLYDKQIAVVPVTGRPAGWCEMIARQWPVRAVVGENGAFYFSYKQGKMQRNYLVSPDQQLANRKKLDIIEKEILKTVPNARVASDQFCRLCDLAIDFAEDVGPLPANEVDQIVAIFKKFGAQAKVSSIHVNGWFGNYDKLGMCQIFAQEQLHLDLKNPLARIRCAFSGDSPNDEPMFAFFENSFAVANLASMQDRLIKLPSFLADKKGGAGFVQIVAAILRSQVKRTH